MVKKILVFGRSYMNMKEMSLKVNSKEISVGKIFIKDNQVYIPFQLFIYCK